MRADLSQTDSQQENSFIVFYNIIFRYILPKTQKYLVVLSLNFFCFCQIYLSNLIKFNLSQYRGGIDNPSYAFDASLCYLCAGVIYIVLLGGSPTELITLVS